MKNSIESIINIYSHLADDESKRIFRNRLMYSITGEYEYILREALETEYGKELEKRLLKRKNNYLFGAGIWGKELAEVWRPYWTGFIDNDPEKYGGYMAGFRIFSLNQIENDSTIFGSTRLYYSEIEKQLMEAGITGDRIVNVGAWIDCLSHRQYFDLSELPHSEEEVFVDCGCFDGKTVESFIKWAESYKHVFCYEADHNNAVICRKYLEKLKAKYTLFEKGVWSCEDRIGFCNKGNGASSIDINSEDCIEVNALDSELIQTNPTFIKMDIEGAELDAIAGTKEIICKHRPKLAISIYHKKEDILEIPKLILTFDDSYKLFLRHYSISMSETVLYAIP